MHSKTNTSFSDFLYTLDSNYQKYLRAIPLFNPQETSHWNNQQKKYFAATFYHLRGHFINFLWYIANFCADEHIKSLILNNIIEELGIKQRSSHEFLYERFAKECGVNIHDEIINETHYLPFAKAFNKMHLQWLSLHDNEERLAAFSAYERLDNLDYPRLTELALSFNLSEQALVFFKVHSHVSHFDSTMELLLPIWQKNPDKLINAFQFIYNHQYQMWHSLSQCLFSLPKQKPDYAACRLFLRNLPGHPSHRQGQKQATSMPPAALAVLVPLDFDPPSGLKIYAPQ